MQDVFGQRTGVRAVQDAYACCNVRMHWHFATAQHSLRPLTFLVKNKNRRINSIGVCMLPWSERGWHGISPGRHPLLVVVQASAATGIMEYVIPYKQQVKTKLS